MRKLLCHRLQPYSENSLMLVTSADVGKWPISHQFSRVEMGHNVANYRPISLLNVFTKIFESLIKEKIMDRISNIFSCNQHAFLAGRSTVSNFLLFMDNVTSELDSGNKVDAIYLNFTKACI